MPDIDPKWTNAIEQLHDVIGVDGAIDMCTTEGEFWKEGVNFMWHGGVPYIDLEAQKASMRAVLAKHRGERKKAKRTALYRHFDEQGELLYVGVSLHVIRRLIEHRASEWSQDIARIEIEYHPSRKAALKAETAAIAKERPKFNVAQNYDDEDADNY
jgi:predicted GIY-YIG superfamily endonuclease